ncbi:hypothetical protein C8F04DRAFT_1086099 [Mycena alexandri]|uniref:Myb-like domain-containing protein n=1 Tax=Mycena alexandri TaxID=1745969 RepID=A0AAD6T4I2_9AGAR|nr:hypothetical protein C8F04DRAFT_1086099 [Mycena alexandri]
MDNNPQHYQPLSYALHPPTSTTPKPSGPAPAPATSTQQAEEEEEGEDEIVVADHLTPNDHANAASTSQGAVPLQFLQEPDPGAKRRPGRPRGSKTKKVSPPEPTPAKTEAIPAPNSMGTGTAPPQLPEVTSQTQQYYEFQWRVLNLCAEFYGAAEELVKNAPPLVVAQCYQMGPGSKVDPIIMLNDAKRICDSLLANPAQLILSPPPPLYPVVPTFYRAQPTTTTVASSSPEASTSTPKPPAIAPAPPAPTPAPPPPPSTVITNPSSFVVSLGTQPAYPYASYPPSAQYPGPYYAPYGYAPGYYAPPQSQPQAQPSQPAPPSQPPPAQASSSSIKPLPPAVAAAGNGGTQGPWSDDEVERLKKLTEDSKASSASKEIEWDWVVGEYGPGRTRHQILLKATNLGLKESKGKGTKRRREADDSGASASPAAPPNPGALNSKMAASTSTPSNTTGSPAMSHATSTPIASPAMHTLQRPPSANRPPQTKAAPTTTTTSGLPWPMPTVAAANVSPVLSSSTQGEQRTSYYRPRPAPTDTSARPSTQFSMYNGPAPNSGS